MYFVIAVPTLVQQSATPKAWLRDLLRDLQTFTGFSVPVLSLLKYCCSARNFNVLPASQNCVPKKKILCFKKYMDVDLQIQEVFVI